MSCERVDTANSIGMRHPGWHVKINICTHAASGLLQVREEAPQITAETILTAMDKIKLGLPQRPLEDSPAKRRMSTVEVGRAVAIALTPGMPPIENLSTKPRGGVMGRILFRPQVYLSPWASALQLPVPLYVSLH